MDDEKRQKAYSGRLDAGERGRTEGGDGWQEFSKLSLLQAVRRTVIGRTGSFPGPLTSERGQGGRWGAIVDTVEGG